MSSAMEDDVEVSAIPEVRFLDVLLPNLLLQSWCDGAKDYWKVLHMNIDCFSLRCFSQNQSATVNGMLGGFDYLAEQDVKGSKVFLNKLKAELPGTQLVLGKLISVKRVY